jgi:AAA-like domain/TIR domain
MELTSNIEIFISYSHKDEDLREELVTHLSNLRRQGKITAWHDRAIEAGTEWEAQIKDHLESAQVILLLISPPFMASTYCYDIEMQRAIERHQAGTARVIPIILRPVDWKDTPFSMLQALPKDALPVTKWGDRDSAFLDVVQGIRRAVESLSQKKKIEASTDFDGADQKQPITFLGVDIEQIAQLADEAFSDAAQDFNSQLTLTPVLIKKSVAVGAAVQVEEPEEIVGINSPFYIQRPPREARCYQAISKRGGLVRIKAPKQMGKSSLMIRVLDQAQQLGYRTVRLNLQSADESSFTDLDCFLRWFCASIGQELELPENVDAYWQSKIFDSKRKCINFFRSFVLQEIQCPVVLALDDVDRIFHFPAIYHDFFGLLRSWHESAKIERIWENLRMIVVHSQEAYIPLDILQSPFNVGTGIELVAFNKVQVEMLAARHHLKLSHTEVDELMAMLGGHPYLTRLALYSLTGHDTSLSQLLQTAPTQSGLFTEHLRRHLNHLRTHPKLLVAMRQVVMTDYPVRLSDDSAFQLDSMGLIVLVGNDAKPRCDLYRLYFRDRLNP